MGAGGIWLRFLYFEIEERFLTAQADAPQERSERKGVGLLRSK
jgi:hypothetical protein